MAAEFYPMLCVENVAETVNFYEDYFDFTPVYEDDAFVRLQLIGNAHVLLTIVDCNHPDLPQEYRSVTKNVILNFPVKNIKEKYDELYMEGLAVHSLPVVDSCGYPHFFVSDPNGNLIDVMQQGYSVDKPIAGHTSSSSDKASEGALFA